MSDTVESGVTHLPDAGTAPDRTSANTGGIAGLSPAHRPARPLCFVDIESDGLHPDRKAWEVALLRRDTNGQDAEKHFFLSIDLSTADPKALEVGRFYDRHPAGRRIAHPSDAKKATQVLPITQAAPLIARMTHGATIVGAVPSFDTEILDRLLRENGLVPSWHYRLVCVESLTAGYLHHEIGGLARCAEALGITPHAEHTALGDARTARAIYDHIMTAPTVLQAVA